MMEFLSVLWFFLIFVLIAGYFVLDGFDLGIGVLSPFIAKNDEERAVLRRAIGPVWDGNEVWLLTAGGALFAAFPDAYATTFSGFYLAVMLVLCGLIVRAVSFEFRAGDPSWGKLWDACFFVGSLLPALLLGVAVGNIFAGIPMDAALTGLLGLAMFLAAGSCWAALKAPLPSCLQARAARLRLPLQVIALALFAVVSVYALVLVGPEMDPNLGILRWLFAALVVVGLLASLVVGKTSGDDLKAFLAQSASMIALVALLACSMFPVLVNATADSVGPAITLANAASSELSLTWMTIILCIGLPLVLVYHVVIYRTFRGRVNPADLEEY